MSQDLKLALEQHEVQTEVARLSAELKASQVAVCALQAEAEKPAQLVARLNAELEASQATVLALKAEVEKPALDSSQNNSPKKSPQTRRERESEGNTAENWEEVAENALEEVSTLRRSLNAKDQKVEALQKKLNGLLDESILSPQKKRVPQSAAPAEGGIVGTPKPKTAAELEAEHEALRAQRAGAGKEQTGGHNQPATPSKDEQIKVEKWREVAEDALEEVRNLSPCAPFLLTLTLTRTLTRTLSLSIILVVMMRSKELKTSRFVLMLIL